MCRIKCSDRFEKIKYVSGKRGTFTWNGSTYTVDPGLCYRTRMFLGIKCFALDYQMGNPNPINYFSSSGDVVDKGFKATPDLVAETYRQIIEGIKPILILICVILAIVVAGISAYLSYDAGQKLNGIYAMIKDLVPAVAPIVPIGG